MTGWTYLEYNDEGHVTKVTKPNGDIIELTYYATGKRAKKVLKIGENTTTWKYHWDGDIPVKIEKVDGDPAYFTFLQPGDILTMTYQSNTYFYVTNIRGDVTALIDVDGNQVASYKYDVWGNPTITNPNNIPNPFLYQGAYATFYDLEFLMYGMGARHYNPNTMRFTSRDANHGTITNTMSQNLYIYCYNNPIGYKDPSGFDAVCGGGSFRGRNNDPFGSFYDGGPRADSSPQTQADAKAMADMWDWCVKEGVYKNTQADYNTFVKVWWQSKEVARKMQKYQEKQNDTLDESIAFWSCWWNDKAGLGLNTDGCIELANFVKGITYIETSYGNDYSAKSKTDGLMQVEADTLHDAIQTGYVDKSFNDIIEKSYVDKNGVQHYRYKKGKGLWIDQNNFNASLYAGIGCFLKQVGGKIIGDVQNLTDLTNLIKGKLNPSGGNLSHYSAALTAYGGPNGFVLHYFGVSSEAELRNKYPNWETTNPYGNAVVDIITTGSMYRYASDKKAGKLEPVGKIP